MFSPAACGSDESLRSDPAGVPPPPVAARDLLSVSGVRRVLQLDKHSGLIRTQESPTQVLDRVLDRPGFQALIGRELVCVPHRVNKRWRAQAEV